MDKSSEAVITLEVTLDTSDTANPNVMVSPRELSTTGQKLRWIEADDSPDFVFESLEIDPEVFANQQVSVNKRRISCDNNGTDGAFEYEISVKHNGQTYNSTKRTFQQTGGKPTIHNH